MKLRWTHWLLIGTILGSSACGSPPAVTDGGDVTSPDGPADRITPSDRPVPDVTEDVAPDVTVDVIEDAEPEDGKTMPDSAMDAAPDTAPDGTMDATMDASMDAGLDAGTDASTDASMDVVRDAASDAPPDGMAMCPPVVRTLMLPTDTAMGRTMGSSLLTAGCTSASGPEHVYRLNVAARTGVVLDITAAEFDTVLSVRRVCTDPMTNVACNDDRGGGITRSFIRTVLDPGEYFVIVDGYSSSASGSYTLAVSSFTPATNSDCSGATALMAGSTVMGDTRTGGNPSSACLASSNGPQLFYSISVPAGQRLRVTATPTGTPAWTPVVRILDSCTATSCLASAQAPMAGMAATATFDNRGTTARNVIVSVSSTSADTGGTFNLQATLEMAPSGPTHANCSMARMVTSGTRLMGEDTTLATTPASCASSAGNALFYTATIPAGHILSVTATPTGTAWDPQILLQNNCTATMCLAAVDDGFSGEAETLVYRNASATAQTVIIAVGSVSARSGGTFNLAVDIAMPPYTETMIPTACDDMSSAMTLSGLTSDDSATAIQMLPFSFNFMGEMVTHYSVTSNGFAQLWTSATGTPSRSAFNSPIPSSTEPNNFVAPLWDDLDVGTMTDARVATFGTSPNRHFTIQWTNWTFYRDSTSRLTFQVKLFETTGVIEFHYCSITPGSSATRATGDSATVGVENRDGTQGHQHSYNTAGSISTMNAIRLTPSP